MIQLPLKPLLVLAIGTTFAILGNMLILIMIGQVNRKLAEDQQISYVHWGIGKVVRHHRRLYPGSYLSYLSLVCGVITVLSFAMLAWYLGPHEL